MSKELLDGLSDIDAAAVVRCARTLLRRPLLTDGGPEGELLVVAYRHRVTLQELFARLLGYRLVVERRFARLYKAGPGDDATAGTRGPAGLGPRGYAYLALTAAVLTGAGRQVLLSRLVADVRAAAARLGLAVPDDIADRRALTAALRLLVTLGVLTETEGTVGGLGGDEEAGADEALITVDIEVLATLVSGPLAAAESPEQLLADASAPGARGAEHAVRRRLVEHPVVHYAELPAGEAEWLRGNVRRESWLLEKYFGLFTESRAEGVLASDPEEYLSDITFPGASSAARMALLALPELLASGATGPGGTVVVRADDVRRVCDGLLADYPVAWSKRAAEDRGGLVTDVLAVLQRAGLAERADSGAVTLSPSAHRWSPVAEGEQEARLDPASPPGGWSLFDVDVSGVDEGEDR